MGCVFFAVAGDREVFREQALALACAWGRGLEVVGVDVTDGGWTFFCGCWFRAQWRRQIVKSAWEAWDDQGGAEERRGLQFSAGWSM